MAALTDDPAFLRRVRAKVANKGLPSTAPPPRASRPVGPVAPRRAAPRPAPAPGSVFVGSFR